MEWDRPAYVQRVGAGVAVRWEPQCVACTGSPAVWLHCTLGMGAG
jgi:hypothetical protein